MEKRQCKRVKTRQIARICGKLGVINDVSDIGLQVSTAFSPQKRMIDITFEANGQVIKLMGIVQWVKWRKQIKTLNEMGIMVKEAPPEFMDFVREITS
jgi:hypothetical protein